MSMSGIDYVMSVLVGDKFIPYVKYGVMSTCCIEEKIIIVPSGWFENRTMPCCPVREFEGMPIFFGEPRMEERDGTLIIYADFIASTFFMLTRYEELLNPVRDIHGRFPGKASFLYKNGFLDRPIVDEYGRWLRSLIAKKFVATVPKEKNRISKLWLTHDVDTPFETRGLMGRFRDVASNLLKRHRFSFRPITEYVTGRSSPYTFPWLLDFDQGVINHVETCKKNVEAVYFILARKDGDARDNWYLDDSRWRQLLKEFRRYGITLGLHVSYAAGGDMKSVVQELEALKPYLQIPSVPLSPTRSPCTYSRHHFLRMTDPSDFAYLEGAGVTDDFSVGYADVAGFRVGTCRPYRWIDPQTGRVGKLLVHPMTIMECTLDGSNYMGLPENEARTYAFRLIDRVAEFGGECVLLWHNTSLMPTKGNWQRALYCECVRHAKERL